jgi:hypothetical protein
MQDIQTITRQISQALRRHDVTVAEQALQRLIATLQQLSATTTSAPPSEPGATFATN